MEEQDSSAFYPELADSLFRMVSKWREELPKNIPISRIRFNTNKGGDQVIIDFSSTNATLGKVQDPVFRLYRSDKNIEIPIDSISHDSLKIYLHLSDAALVPGDQLSIAFRAGEVTASDGASLLFFSTEPVVNRIQSGPDLFSLGFKVFDGSNDFRLPDVSLKVGSAEALSNENGEVYFKFQEGNYNYSALREDYTSVIDSLALISDTLISIYLYPTLADVKFRVTNGAVPLGNTEVEIAGQNELTNMVGITFFEDLNIGELYPYSISKTGYELEQDTLVMSGDTTVQVVLSLSTGNTPAGRKQIEVFPNPVKDKLHIQSAEPIESIALIDMNGSLLRQMECPSSDCTISLEGISPGVYLLKIYIGNKDSEVISKRISILE